MRLDPRLLLLAAALFGVAGGVPAPAYAEEPSASDAPAEKGGGKPEEVEDEDSPARHLEAKAASVVAVKFVAKVMDREIPISETGTVVDEHGLVMLRNRVKNDRVKFTISNLRVIFPGDEKEHDAIVVATDSRLDLAFVRIRDLGDRKAVPVDLTESPDPEPGTELFAVSRLEQGFDYAPFFGATNVVGRITKPRALGILSGFTPGAHVLFTTDGKAAGVVVPQSGVTDGDERGTRRSFLLPMKAALATIRQAQAAVDAALAAAASEAQEAAPASDAEKPAPASSDGEAAKPDAK
jgi:S1-C subfamily serine protease